MGKHLDMLANEPTILALAHNILLAQAMKEETMEASYVS